MSAWWYGDENSGISSDDDCDTDLVFEKNKI